MRFSHIAGIVGCTTAAFITIAPIQVEAATFKVESGITSIDRDHENILRNIGLIITGTQDIVPPIPSNYLVGFQIDSATDFTFSDEGGFTPLFGTIEHIGTVTFNEQTTVGNFSIGFAPGRTIPNASGLVLTDTISPANPILFDLAAPQSVIFDEQNLTLTLADVQLFISPEFAQALGDSNLVGLFAGTARIDAKVAAVPEPGSALAILAAGAALLAARFCTFRIQESEFKS
ncbi:MULTISPECIES: hypothetical protein [Nostoc]|uniref:PEP-CTERM sorting domain-containing protein n=1 Tax=Nostoc paludosum FACHB-159 TaxID=2692908 RepID=A0ABR8KBT7_9NOSO|nr:MULTISPECIES: hypothetical protein [Nostoc]MBD2679286.1 hypothetical protein [Nostoc sp. FACHB-857]MBD2735668.1 hypothetical protein [Nostoc paludosum FACHB-159]